MLSDQSTIIEQAKFTYSPLGKAFGRQIKAIEKQGKKRVEVPEVAKPIAQKLTIKDVIRENSISKEAKNKLNKIKDRKNVRQRKFII